ncbi:hypothetical protein H6P81_006442 [Aristolochia fimbriata]|uniref:Leucine-rich repeat-containing N-terminal plant-type domain-containing protein n=1 Tax=Aristolochia fimbriata TaxID=158543 RepID=A0AAV7EXR8_ARIFI|nr:hypothetical protein H6P81_006442 [Aristolochia fimbriata]
MAFSFLFPFLLFNLFFPLVSPASVAGQASALLLLKQSFSDVTALGSWNSSNGDCCNEWYGVSCDSDGGIVTGVDLSDLGLSLSPNTSWAPLLNLPGLESLNLAFNSFNSPIPTDLHRLQRLKLLNFSNAGFFGQIPIQVARIPTLVYLDLSVFSLFLSVYPPTLEDPDFETFVQGLSNLEELYLDGLNISSYRTEWCDIVASALPKLRVLSLSNCAITGPLLPSLLKLTRLRVLRLDDNNLSSPVPPFLSNLSSLTSLRLSYCHLIGDFPENIFRIQGLRILDLANNENLRGHFPEFSDESSLQGLTLSGTSFSGELPSSIGKLPFLTKLELRGLNFSGQLPSSLGNLTRLVYLDLSSNNFTGRIPPLNNLKQLVKLDLSSNSLSGPFPAIGDGLPKLSDFSLRNNSIDGSVPSELFTLPSLQTLLLCENRISGGIGNFANASLSKLRTVDLSSNNLQGPVPKSLFELPSLTILQLTSNNFSGEIKLSWLQELKNLSSLELSDNRVSVSGAEKRFITFPRFTTLMLGSCMLNRIPEFLLHQKVLHNLDLSNNGIEGEIPEWLEGPFPVPPSSSAIVDYSDNRFSSAIPDDIGLHIPGVIFFSLSRNDLQGRIPESLCNASYLKVLDLSGNKLNGSIPPCLGKGENGPLTVLNLRGNLISGMIPENFSEGCRLKTLDVNGNQLHGRIPFSLKNCRDLEVLNLGNNMLVGSFPWWLGNLTRLRVLVLRNNRFSGYVNELRGEALKMVQIVDLSSNNFHGTLPRESFERWTAMVIPRSAHDVIQSRVLELTPLYYRDSVFVTGKGLEMELVKILTIFTSLDLSNNNFTGPIPDTFGDLRSLYLLNLSHNALSGSIPASLANLEELESLDLSQNRLSGKIPRELIRLGFLSSLNLSYNRLDGEIPQGNQFRTFSASSFEHNLGLCGPPLEEKCSSTSTGPQHEAAKPKTPSSHKIGEQLIIDAAGFGLGIGTTIALLVIWRRGRRRFYGVADRLLFKIFPAFHR